jgi:hypothetical protein
MAAALAGTLAKMGRPVTGVDGPVQAADAFAAAWSHREGVSIRMHKQCRVYRLAGGPDGMGPDGMGAAAGASGATWAAAGPAGRLRVATGADRALLADWLTAFAAEAAERIGSAQAMADDLIGYGGAVFWESPQRPARVRDAITWDTGAPNGETGYQPVAVAALTRPVAGTVRMSVVYTAPDRRRNGYAAALMYAASRAVLDGVAPRAEPGAGPRAGSQVVMITDTNRPNRGVARLGYQLVGERTVLRFGPPTGPLPGVRTTGPMPRLPTGPLPRTRR